MKMRVIYKGIEEKRGDYDTFSFSVDKGSEELEFFEVNVSRSFQNGKEKLEIRKIAAAAINSFYLNKVKDGHLDNVDGITVISINNYWWPGFQNKEIQTVDNYKEFEIFQPKQNMGFKLDK
jgi:hypothetical protein